MDSNRHTLFFGGHALADKLHKSLSIMGGVSSIQVTQSELLLLLVWEALHELNFCRHHVKPSMIFWMVVASRWGRSTYNACMTNWESPSTYHYVLQTQIPCKEDYSFSSAALASTSRALKGNTSFLLMAPILL